MNIHTYLLSKFPGCKRLYGNSQSSLQDMYCSWVQTTACSTGARPLQMGSNIFWSQASKISRVIDFAVVYDEETVHDL